MSLASCAADDKVSQSSLYGTWKMTDDSRYNLPDMFKDIDSVIVLNDDNTFRMSDVYVGVPISRTEAVPPGQFYTRPRTETGRWTLLDEADMQDVSLSFDGGFGYNIAVDKWLSTKLVYSITSENGNGHIEFKKQQ